MIDIMDELAMTFVSVYRLPGKLTDVYCFGGGNPITFTNVDWFETSIAGGREELEAFIRTKNYFDNGARFLIIGDDAAFTFTIDPKPQPHRGGRYA